MNSRSELPSRTLAAVARIKKRDDQLRGIARDARARVTKCIGVDGELQEHLLRNVADF